MLHRQESAVSAVGPRYTKPGCNGANENAEEEHCVGRMQDIHDNKTCRH